MLVMDVGGKMCLRQLWDVGDRFHTSKNTNILTVIMMSVAIIKLLCYTKSRFESLQ